ncbi:MAG: tRNA lysidine(34) synthetase TilS [Candidatus Edwardsbacteria bacterium]|nr:tRNA lysidine(34) synthetase TilS [Candidatus Edwardsbacteria bacterium]
MAALSGGPDSVALLHGLWSLRKRLGITVCAAHLNHRLRGKESAVDAAWSRSFAKRIGVRFAAGAANVRALAKKKKISLETAAREARKEFLASAARRLKCGRIATGHTMDDQAETVLMRLVRGSGLTGLAGIPRRNGLYIRPLLDIGRDDVLAYLEKNNLTFREDATNKDIGFTRNRVRHRLIPDLKKYNPRVVGALAQLAETVSDDLAAIDAATEEAAGKCIKAAKSQITVDLSVFNGYNIGLKRNIIRRGCQILLGRGAVPDFLHVEQAIHMIDQGKIGKKLELVDGLWAEIGYGLAVLSRRKKNEERPPGRAGAETGIRVPGATRYLGHTLKACIRGTARAGQGNWRGSDKAFFDWDELKRPHLTVGARRDGERIRLFGSARSKKIKELMIEARLPRAQRCAWPVVRAGGAAIWVPGLRRSNAAPIAATTKRTLCLEFIANEA